MDPEPFLPESLEGWAAVWVVFAAIAAGLWRLLISPLRREDKAIKAELARLAQFEHNIGGRVDILERFSSDMQHHRDDVVRELGRFEAQLRNVEEAQDRVSREMGTVSGELRGINDRLDMMFQLLRDVNKES